MANLAFDFLKAQHSFSVAAVINPLEEGERAPPPPAARRPPPIAAINLPLADPPTAENKKKFYSAKKGRRKEKPIKVGGSDPKNK